MVKLGVIVGSLRSRSWNRKVANLLVDSLPQDWEVDFLDIGSIPLYNPEFDEDDMELAVPEAVSQLRAQAEEADAFLIVTAEYNRGIPGPLKNAIDTLSRPKPTIFAGKPVLLATASTGAYGGFGSNHALRQTLMFLDAHVLAQPELYLGHIHESFDDGSAGMVGSKPDLTKDRAEISQRTLELLQKAADKFVAFSAPYLS